MSLDLFEIFNKINFMVIIIDSIKIKKMASADCTKMNIYMEYLENMNLINLILTINNRILR